MTLSQKVYAFAADRERHERIADFIIRWLGGYVLGLSHPRVVDAVLRHAEAVNKAKERKEAERVDRLRNPEKWRGKD